MASWVKSIDAPFAKIAGLKADTILMPDPAAAHVDRPAQHVSMLHMDVHGGDNHIIFIKC